MLDYDDSYSDLSQSSSRSFSRSKRSEIDSVFSAIDGYGCWCYFDDDLGQAKGEPVDSIDEKCKILRQGYQCATLDGELNEEDEVCVPWEVDFTPHYGGDLENIYENCEVENPDNPCGARACAVEVNFIESILPEFTTPGAINDDFKHENGFNVTTCIPETTTTTTTTIAPTVASNVNVIKVINNVVVITSATEAPATTEEPLPLEMCCGEYPVRFKYETLEGDRECCGNSTFDATLHECCDEEFSITHDIGSC